MNKIIVLVFAVMLGVFGFSNQLQASGPGGFGLKGGLAISTIGVEDESLKTAKNRFRLGGTGGIGYEIGTEGSFAFEVEALYSLRGQKAEFDNVLINGEIKDFIHYVYVPASLKFYIKDIFNVHFGGYVGLAMAGNRKLTAENKFSGVLTEETTNLFTEDNDGDKYLNRLDGGIHFGAEFVGEKGIGAGSRGYIGIADITNDKHISGGKTARTGEISIYAIFKFGAKK